MRNKRKLLAFLLIISLNSNVFGDIGVEILKNIVGFDVIIDYSNPLFLSRVFITEEYNISIHPFAGTYYFHEGTDYVKQYGSEIIAPLDGKVFEINSDTVNGKTLVIEHNERLKTEYRHLKQVLVDSGHISKGDIIAILGSSGITTGPNLDFRVIIDEIYYNPQLFFELLSLYDITDLDQIKEYLILDRYIYEYINSNRLFFTTKPQYFEDNKFIYKDNEIIDINGNHLQTTSIEMPNNTFNEGFVKSNETEISYYLSKSNTAIIDNEIKVGDSIEAVLEKYGIPNDISFSIIKNDSKDDQSYIVLKYQLHEITMPNQIGHYINFIIKSNALFAVELNMVQSE